MKAGPHADRSSKAFDASAAAVAPSVGGRLAPQVITMFRALTASPQRTKILLLGLSLIAVIGATAYGQISLNAWNRPFYDAIGRRDLHGFLVQLVDFGVIAGLLLVLNVVQAWLNQATKVKLREGIVRDLFDEWLKPRRAFRLVNAGEMGSNPDQRIHEDARHLAELTADLAIGLLQSSLLLGSFIGVLWILSGSVPLQVSGRGFSIPGYMVWCALASAGTGSWLSWRVGRPLIELNTDRYAQEAELRFELVRLNEHIDAASLSGGEEDENRRLTAQLKNVLRVMWRIVNASTRLTWVTAGYGWFTIIAPIVFAAPGYFAGDLSLGSLMMAVGAFNQVQQTLRWFIDNFSTIADWRATLIRIASFRQKVVTMDTLGATENQIEFVEATADKCIFENLQVATPTGCIKLSEGHVEIGLGDHALIVGEPGTGKTLLFQAIAGLWPWGSGRVALPSSDGVMFMTRQPYVPLGTLRAALTYPSREIVYKDEELVAALQSAGLNRLSTSLDHIARWERELTDDEQQWLVFARALLQMPRWLVIDEALESLDDDARKRVISLCKDRLKDAAIIYIGRPETKSHFFTQVLHLIKDPHGSCFIPDLSAASGGPTNQGKITR